MKWQGKAVEEATWEDVVVMRSQFPTFNIEDKVAILKGSVVRGHMLEGDPKDVIVYHKSIGPKIRRIYSKRGKKDSEA